MRNQQDGSNDYASVAISIAFMAFTIAFYSAVLVLADRSGHAPERLVRDPAAVFEFWPFYGSISQIGILLMAATSAICLFTALHVKVNRGLLTSIGFFSGYFLLDDAFMLHESFYPGLGIREKISLVPMALWALWIFTSNRAHFLQWGAIAIWISGSFLAASIIMDAVFGFGSLETWIEDGLKFAGLAMWALHWVFVASRSLQRSISQASSVG